MATGAIILCIALGTFIICRQVRGGHNRDNKTTIEFLCDEAENKYPGMPLSDALDMLYRNYYDRLVIAREKKQDVAELIRCRQLIARERARLLVAESHSETGFELIHSAQA